MRESWVTQPDVKGALTRLSEKQSFRAGMLEDFAQTNLALGLSPKLVYGNVAVLLPPSYIPECVYIGTPESNFRKLRANITSVTIVTDQVSTHFPYYFDETIALDSDPSSAPMQVIEEDPLWALSNAPPKFFDSILYLWQQDLQERLTPAFFIFAAQALAPGGRLICSGDMLNDQMMSPIQELRLLTFESLPNPSPAGISHIHFFHFYKSHRGGILQRPLEMTSALIPSIQAMQRRVSNLTDEQFNAEFIIQDKVDGSMPFTLEEIDRFERLCEKQISNNGEYDPESMPIQLTAKLMTETDSWRRIGTYSISGHDAFNIVDTIDDILANLPVITLPDYADSLTDIVSGALCVHYKLPYRLFQLDIRITGQGNLPDTYEISVTFRPQPKNIQ